MEATPPRSTLLGPLGLLLALFAAAPARTPASDKEKKTTEADVPAAFADYLSKLAARVHLLRKNRGERSREPGVGRMAAALGHVHGWPHYPTHPEDRRLMEDLLTVLAHDPERAHEVSALRARMVAHYLQHPAPEDRAGGAHAPA